MTLNEFGDFIYAQKENVLSKDVLSIELNASMFVSNYSTFIQSEKEKIKACSIIETTRGLLNVDERDKRAVYMRCALAILKLHLLLMSLKGFKIELGRP